MASKQQLKEDSEYQSVKRKKLKLKGNKPLLFGSGKLKKKRKLDESTSQADLDAQEHGGWRLIEDESDLKGGANICIECHNNPGTYVAAMDDGRFITGGPHSPGEGPNPEEILSLIKTPDDPMISMKTGYGKYVGVDAEGKLIAVADAVGSRERLIVVFQDGKSALQSASSNMFLSMKPDSEGYLYVVSKKAQEDEMINLRTNSAREGPIDWQPLEDKQCASMCESTYIKMYQHSKVALKGKNIIVDLNDKKTVRKAQEEGNLHEQLLERRVKTKSDKYC